MTNKITENCGEVLIHGARYRLDIEVEGSQPAAANLHRGAEKATDAFRAFAQNLKLPKDQIIDFAANGYIVGDAQTAYKEQEQRLWGVFQNAVLGGPAPLDVNAPAANQPQPKVESPGQSSPVTPSGNARARVSPALSLLPRAKVELMDSNDDDEPTSPAKPAALAQPNPSAVPAAAPVVAPQVVAQSNPPAAPPQPAAASENGAVAPQPEVPVSAALPLLGPPPESPVQHRPILAPAEAENEWENRRWGYFREIIEREVENLDEFIAQNEVHRPQLEAMRTRYETYRNETLAANERAMRRCNLPFVGHLVRHIGFLSERRPVLSLAEKLREDLRNDERLELNE